MEKYSFSGHETFQCKSLWLKKGYDYVMEGYDFNSDEAVVLLGVGKNMVASIRFWLKAFGMIGSDGKPTAIADYLLGEEGCDPYLEDPNTLWLLHYLLVSRNYATIYKQTFLDFHKERKSFTKEHLRKFIQRRFDNKAFGNTPYNENTIKKDIDTLIKNYVTPDKASFDDFSSTLQPLGIISALETNTFQFANAARVPFHPCVFLYAIKDQCPTEHHIDYDVLADLSQLFCISQNAMTDMFQHLSALIPTVTFSNVAGEQLFAINNDMGWRSILNLYYQQR